MQQKTLKDFRASYRVVVKGVVRDAEGRVLLVRERADTWDLPGGGLEHGETDLAQTLVREFTEELDTGVAAIGNFNIFPTWNTKFDAPVLLLVCTCRLTGEPALTTDVRDYAYMTANELRNVELDSTLENGVIRKILDTLLH